MRPPGEPGEIIVQGPNVTSGYWNNEVATAAALSQGWLRTGDLGVADDDGFVWIVDRVKDMIISGGENIYPAEVETAIYEHPDVSEAAVIGVPDEKWGEVGKAVIALKPGSTLDGDQLLAWLAGRIARYKMPRSAVVVDELPHTASGKILKRDLRDQFGAPDKETS